MSGVRVLVGTKKGAFVMTSDAKRERWDVSGPHLAGWEIYHIKGSPADPNRLYMSQSSGWFGQLIQRSNDGGKTWEPVGNQFTYEGVPGTHQWYDGSLKPWEFKRVWHLEPSLTDPDTVYAGVVAAHDVPVLLHEQHVRPRRVHGQAMHAMADLGVRIGDAFGFQATVHGLPGGAAVFGAERAGGGDGHEDALRLRKTRNRPSGGKWWLSLVIGTT